MKRYDHQVAVVTGASSGIGRRIAIDLAERGATVIGVARRAGWLEELQADLREFAPANETQVCDVADTAQLRARLAEIEARHRRVDILINNAGIDAPTSVTSGASLETFANLMAVNYFAAVAGTLAVLPGMLERRVGIIVNVSSDSARAPEPRDGGYAASKAAVSAFTESAAHELGGTGVHLHVLYPAWVPTAMGLPQELDARLPPKAVRRTEAQVSNLMLERMGGTRIDINAALLPVVAILGRIVAPRLYQRAMREYEQTHT